MDSPTWLTATIPLVPNTMHDGHYPCRTQIMESFQSVTEQRTPGTPCTIMRIRRRNVCNCVCIVSRLIISMKICFLFLLLQCACPENGCGRRSRSHDGCMVVGTNEIHIILQMTIPLVPNSHRPSLGST